MKVLLVANTGWYLHNFRSGLAARLLDAGLSVVAVCPYDPHVDSLQRLGLRWVEWRLQRSGTAPLTEIQALMELAAIYRSEQPDVVHHFTIKPVLYGAVASKWNNIERVVNSVTGLGHMFVSRRPTARLLRPYLRRWYSWALTTGSSCAMFQNPDDLLQLAGAAPDIWGRSVLTYGSGVDLTRFHPGDQAERGSPPAENRMVLFAGRLIAEKGICDFVDAARTCRARQVPADFVVCGESDPHNPSSIPIDRIREWQAEQVVELRGHLDPIDSVLRQADLVVLPSYREGTPRILLEAAAAGKAIIATDVPGCRQVVIDGVNGRLVPAGRPTLLADAIEGLIRDEGLRQRMGQASRQRAVALFDEQEVIDQTLLAYRVPPTHRNSTLSDRPPLERGIFTFSLDFELAWGTRGRRSPEDMAPFLEGTRDAVQGMLGMFEKYDIGATWATVGALLMPAAGGAMRHSMLAAPEFNDIPAGDARSHPFWYGEDLVEQLLGCRTPQEIGCHTLTHTLVDPRPQGREPFRRDLCRFLDLCRELHLPQPSTFIFPRGRMGHFDVLTELGFRCIRGPEAKWFEYLPGTLPRAACRLIDARLAVPPRVDQPKSVLGKLWVIPSSQFYSPFQGVGRRVSVEARVKKAVRGLRLAARNRGIFHLWSHPFNFGVRSDELLPGIEQILQEASRLRDAGCLDVLSMSAIADRLDAGAGLPPRSAGQEPSAGNFLSARPHDRRLTAVRGSDQSKAVPQ